MSTDIYSDIQEAMNEFFNNSMESDVINLLDKHGVEYTRVEQETHKFLNKQKETTKLLSCSECAIFSQIQPCEACDNNLKKHKKRLMDY